MYLNYNDLIIYKNIIFVNILGGSMGGQAPRRQEAYSARYHPVYEVPVQTRIRLVVYVHAVECSLYGT